jgi:stage V sporulation protein AA
MRHRVEARVHEKVRLADIAQIIAPETLLTNLKNIVVHQVTEKDKNIIVIDVMKVIRLMSTVVKGSDIQTIGPAQTIVQVLIKEKVVTFPFFILIWFLLFFGSAMGIMNFHDDVSMSSVQEKIYFIITGKNTIKPLLFQIPYSIGLGLGMILFFNHVFRKRINEEPSPLEVEMFNYQQDIDNYIVIHENKESMKQLDHD